MMCYQTDYRQVSLRMQIFWLPIICYLVLYFTEELYKNLILDSKESNQTRVYKANLALEKAEYDMVNPP